MAVILRVAILQRSINMYIGPNKVAVDVPLG